MVTGIEAVFLNNRETLLRFLYARGAGNGAEDLLQELWIKASAPTAQPVAQPLAYLYRMANNLMLDRVRSDMRRRGREEAWSDQCSVAADELVAHANSGERILLAQERLQAVEAALSGLGERTETIFRRFRLDGLTQREIARENGITVSAVEKHLQKAYRALVGLRNDLDAE